MNISKDDLNALPINEFGLTGFAFSIKLVGKKYLFFSEYDLHYHVLGGRIMSISLTSKNGFELLVTNTEFWGQKIRSIMKTEKGWALRFIQSNKKNEQTEKCLEGKLQILDIDY